MCSETFVQIFVVLGILEINSSVFNILIIFCRHFKHLFTRNENDCSALLFVRQINVYQYLLCCCCVYVKGEAKDR